MTSDSQILQKIYQENSKLFFLQQSFDKEKHDLFYIQGTLPKYECLRNVLILHSVTSKLNKSLIQYSRHNKSPKKQQNSWKYFLTSIKILKYLPDTHAPAVNNN